ncbi:MAG: hypothetical protein ACI8V5_004643, partial [Limisphaerales bacterium]
MNLRNWNTGGRKLRNGLTHAAAKGATPMALQIRLTPPVLRAQLRES